jgi:hypothetical protein
MSENSPGQKKLSLLRRVLLAIFALVLIAGLVFGGFYLGTHNKKPNQTLLLQGRVALSEKSLRDVVQKNSLTAYWAGPISGDTYSIFVPKPGVAVVRYIPPGASVTDASPDFRLVATYVQKNAFATTRAGAAVEGNIGFINIDGNAVFYVKTRPTNVYVGIKGKDVQLEIFDPGQDQAVALALFRGQIRQIK